jgi:hypothetical protein
MPKEKTQKLEERLEEAGMTLEELAVAIEKVSNGVEVLFNSRITYDTLVMLISRSSKVSQKDVKAVLDCLPQLKREYLK